MSFAFAVEHFSKFWRFCSALGSARAGFWGSGRQKRGIPPFFCLLSDPREPILKGQVDKKEAFIPFFVYFQDRAPRFVLCGRLSDVLSCFHQRALCIFQTNRPHLQIIVKCSAALRAFINIQELLSKRSTIHLNRTA